MELVKLRKKWVPGLNSFLIDLRRLGEDKYFRPHAEDIVSLSWIVENYRSDVYLVLIDGLQVLGYALLRGWDEGYLIPSVGVAVHKSVRGMGLGRMLMRFLEIEAKRKGATQIRLRVNIHNRYAKSLYASLGYRFSPDLECVDNLVGLKDLY